ncbi:response regulator transcription factor [Sphingomonas crocodyli]|uniref:Response regulator transcription factor n=1 Tax=Sphingomonas crocodyli TaxID=1979270 RepID=A0A437M9Z8_9SPHN|nr:response regulator transcription factor [Sphingomonas crocodyli]RVT94469.1 response regulator transcription factor [Sphingomonas crocodyli]
MRLLIVEDNDELARLLGEVLARAGLASDRAATLADGQLLLDVSHYAAVILDLGLGDEDGLALLRSLRARGDATPVLILTARGAVSDRVAGLNQGSDDYLVKPFAPEELVARIHALLRRPDAAYGRSIRAGAITLDIEAQDLRIAGRSHQVPAREMQLLVMLARQQGRVVRKAQLESALFGADDDYSSNAVEVYMHRLRRRLEALGAGVGISTVRGVGYMLAEDRP